MSILDDRRRLVLEAQAVRERWGDRARLCRDASGQLLWWEYTIELEGNKLPIRVVYPEDYPASPPEIVLNCLVPVNTPHLLPTARTAVPGQRICWYYPSESRRTRNVWNPAMDTAAVAIAAAHRWALAFVVWLSLGEWPVPDAVR